MSYPRFIVGLMALTIGILLADSPSLAQNPALLPPEDPWSRFGSDPFDQLEPAEDPPHTAMEAEAQQMGSNSDILFSPHTPQPGVPPAGGDTVSVQQLRHPLSRKARGLLAKAESFFKHGQRDKGKQQLAEAIKEPSAAPYAHAMLGTEYLRDGQAHAAIPELETAARSLPIASVHSNLGFAFCLTGDIQRGQQEFQQALSLDGNSAKTRFLLGIVLLDEKSTEGEALYDLNLAQKQVRTAHLALAIAEMRRGDMDAGQRQVRQFLGSSDPAAFSKVLRWATVAAAQPHPTVAFGFPEKTTSAVPPAPAEPQSDNPLRAP